MMKHKKKRWSNEERTSTDFQDSQFLCCNFGENMLFIISCTFLLNNIFSSGEKFITRWGCWLSWNKFPNSSRVACCCCLRFCEGWWKFKWFQTFFYNILWKWKKFRAIFFTTQIVSNLSWPWRASCNDEFRANSLPDYAHLQLKFN